jgi:hypothetical protein
MMPGFLLGYGFAPLSHLSHPKMERDKWNSGTRKLLDISVTMYQAG